MPRSAEHVLNAGGIDRRWSWVKLGMCVPVANVVLPFLEQSLDLPALRRAVRNEGSEMAAIRRPRPSGTLNSNHSARYAREQLPAGLAAVRFELPMVHQMLDHWRGEDERLT